MHDSQSAAEPLGTRLALHSPWLVTAVLAHAVAIAIASILYYGHEQQHDDGTPTSMAIRVDEARLPEVPAMTIAEQRDEQTIRDTEIEPNANSSETLEVTDDPPLGNTDAADFDAQVVTPTPGDDGGSTAIGPGAGHRVPGPSANSGAPGTRKTGKSTGRPDGDGRGVRGPKADFEAVADALAWLRAHQDADGHWDADQFMKHDASGEPCSGPGNPTHDVGVTGLALLAFLGAGNTPRDGRHRQVVRNGVRWLIEQQDGSGRIGEATSQGHMYSHAIAALVLCEAYGLSQHRPYLQPAQAAINFIVQARNPYGVWRYQPRDVDGDASVTAWMVQALLSAKEFGLAVDDTALRTAMTWFDGVTDPATGAAGYTRVGEGSSRPVGKVEKFPAAKTEALTSAALLCRCLMLQDPKETPVMQRAADTIAQKAPVWNESDGSIDMYYWYYASYALYQMGGREWDQWSKKMSPAALRSQRKDGNARGSWDPKDPWGDDGGRVYSTAMMALCLEAHYRYSRVLGAR